MYKTRIFRVLYFTSSNEKRLFLLPFGRRLRCRHFANVEWFPFNRAVSEPLTGLPWSSVIEIEGWYDTRDRYDTGDSPLGVFGTQF